MPRNRRTNQEHGSSTGTQEERNDRLELEGCIEESLPGTLFKVKCDNGHQVLCTLSGKIRLNRIRIMPGDRVSICVSPYDLSRGRITYRL